MTSQHHTRGVRSGLLGVLLVALVAGCGATVAPAAIVDEIASPASSLAATPRAIVLSTPKPASTPAATMSATPSPEPPAEPDVVADPVPALPNGAITAAAAAKRVNKVAIVCGKVASATYAKTTKGKPTFLNLDKPFPKAIFTIVIWKEDRPAFAVAPEKAFLNEWACIQGRVENYKGIPQITSVGGDVMRPDDFVPWTKDELACVKRGTRMGWGCETYLDVQIEIRAVLVSQGYDAYYDVMDDLNDFYTDGLSDWDPYSGVYP